LDGNFLHAIPTRGCSREKGSFIFLHDSIVGKKLTNSTIGKRLSRAKCQLFSEILDVVGGPGLATLLARSDSNNEIHNMHGCFSCLADT
jgi:hypothetical protein